ncbi:MAG: hypothetical protein ACTXOO_02765 [Sodalis sp. (in: enterobacteria)]
MLDHGTLILGCESPKKLPPHYGIKELVRQRMVNAEVIMTIEIRRRPLGDIAL